MHKLFKKTSLLACLLCIFTASTHAQDEKITLKLGDPAPSLSVGEWLQGEPVTKFAEGTTYIVEFWATWCPPCIGAIPHLNEIHQKFKDQGLVVIGQNVWERNEAAVPGFIKKMGDKMTYRVATDQKNDANPRGLMAKTWMQAAGRNGIPCSFIIDRNGKIAWIGHPSRLKEKFVARFLAEDYSIETQKSTANLSELYKKFRKLTEHKEYARALETVDEALKIAPEEVQPYIQADRIFTLIRLEKNDEANTAANKFINDNTGNQRNLNHLAWGTTELQLAADSEMLATAEKAAQLAADSDNQQTPGVLDTLARVVFMRGDHDRAIEIENKALELAKEQNDKKSIDICEKTLAKYKLGELPEFK